MSIENELSEVSGIERLEGNQAGHGEWLRHAYEECLDMANYLRRAIEGGGRDTAAQFRGDVHRPEMWTCKGCAKAFTPDADLDGEVRFCPRCGERHLPTWSTLDLSANAERGGSDPRLVRRVDWCPAFPANTMEHAWSVPRNGHVECLWCFLKRTVDPPNAESSHGEEAR